MRTYLPDNVREWQAISTSYKLEANEWMRGVHNHTIISSYEFFLILLPITS